MPPRKPDPIVVADVRARAIRSRGPRGPQDGALYWRAELGKRTVWAGWGTREEAAAAIVEVVARGVEGMRPQVGSSTGPRSTRGARWGSCSYTHAAP